MLRNETISTLAAGEVARRGVGYVPGDRFRNGLARDFTIAENLVLGQRWAPGGAPGPPAFPANGAAAIGALCHRRDRPRTGRRPPSPAAMRRR